MKQLLQGFKEYVCVYVSPVFACALCGGGGGYVSLAIFLADASAAGVQADHSLSDRLHFLLHDAVDADDDCTCFVTSPGETDGNDAADQESKIERERGKKIGKQ